MQMVMQDSPRKGRKDKREPAVERHHSRSAPVNNGFDYNHVKFLSPQTFVSFAVLPAIMKSVDS